MSSRRDDDGAGGRQFYGVSRRENLAGGLCALDAVNTIAPVLVALDAPRMKDDVAVLRAPQGIGLDAARSAIVGKIDTKPVGGGEADNFQGCL